VLALMPYVAAGSAASLVTALLARSKGAALAATGLAVTHAVLLAPRWTPEPPPAAGTPLRVMSANLLFGGADPEQLTDLVRRERPDILTLVELTPQAVANLERAGLDRELPYRVLDLRSLAAGSGIYARRPLHADGEAATTFAAPAATIAVGGRTVSVVAAHTVPPRPGSIGTWKADLDALAAKTVKAGDPVVAAGDFNATLDHPSFLRFLSATGLRDAHDARGRGLVRTWPEGERVPAFAQLDHVLVSGALGVRAVREHRLADSDHRTVVAELVLTG
jgi:endonuclease/exonuclease/phosphatase (EEP) superfamily protein YafD